MIQFGNRSLGNGGRAVGVLYLAYFVFAFLGLFLMRGVVVTGNTEETAKRLLGQGDFVRAAVAASLIADVLYLALVARLYRLFGSADVSTALVGAFVGAVGCAVQLFAEIFRLAPYVILSSSSLGSVFAGSQLAALASVSLALYTQCFYISLVLFGIYDVITGYLIVKGRFVPRIIGGMMIVAGIGWLAFLWPSLTKAVGPIVLPVGALAEIALMLWLLLRGVDLEALNCAGGTGRTAGRLTPPSSGRL